MYREDFHGEVSLVWRSWYRWFGAVGVFVFFTCGSLLEVRQILFIPLCSEFLLTVSIDVQTHRIGFKV
jgi:hypothetical protein